MPTTHSPTPGDQAQYRITLLCGFSLLESLVSLLLVSLMALLIAQSQQTLAGLAQQQRLHQIQQVWQAVPLEPEILVAHLTDLAACHCTQATERLALWCELCTQLPPLELHLHQQQQAYQLELEWRASSHPPQRIWLRF